MVNLGDSAGGPGPAGEAEECYRNAADAVPELARRGTLSSCRQDPVGALAPVLAAMPAQGIPLGDILDYCGYSHRGAGAWAIPLRRAEVQLVQDLHPLFVDRGPKGTHDGAIIANGNPYCPATPRPLLELGPLARAATEDQAADWERTASEFARYKPGRLTSDDLNQPHRTEGNHANTNRTTWQQPQPPEQNARTSDPNVKMIRTET